MVKQQVNKLFKRFPAFAFYKSEVEGVLHETLDPLFATEWGRRASWGALGVFALLLAIAVVQMLSDWYDDILISRSTSTSVQHSEIDNVSQLIAAIPEEHLFGRIGSNDQSIPITSLQLRLVGVIKSEPESLSRVIISESGQPGKLYSIGDSLPSGIIVNAIKEDGVVLENGGRLEKLPLQRTPLNFKGMPQPLYDQER